MSMMLEDGEALYPIPPELRGYFTAALMGGLVGAWLLARKERRSCRAMATAKEEQGTEVQRLTEREQRLICAAIARKRFHGGVLNLYAHGRIEEALALINHQKVTSGSVPPSG
ncbi:hypothetical protein HOY80DRAFT_1133972 [Tuber brumale]|nr:hypothetical protein HOY80DRAFT_1133972 [Tuber brumale]